MLDYIYKHSPVFIQNLMCSLYGWKESKSRFNENFVKKLKLFQESDFYKEDDIFDYKKTKLVNILQSAKNSNYPFAHYLSCVDDDQIAQAPFQVLESLPILTKHELSGYCPEKTDRNAIVMKTSGTTGRAIKVLKDKEAISTQWAIWFRHRSRFNITLESVSVNFTGKPVVPASQKTPPFWRYNSHQKQYLISMQSVNKENIASIVSFLNSIKPSYYSGYPSIISEVCRLAIDSGLKLEGSSRPKLVFCGAEKVLEHQNESIVAWTQALVTDQYGLTEGNCNFSKCEHGHYHEDFEFCHIELVDTHTSDTGLVTGRLIGTSFYNEVMPLIRYDTGDIATFAPSGFKCPCGRESRVIYSVDGRSDDYVILNDGRKIMRFDYLFKDTYEVFEAQVIQEELGSITVKAVKSTKFNKQTFEAKVRKSSSDYICKDLKVKFDYVNQIERTGSGKFKAVVNRL
ncbi:Coenzyme F390 synthetase-like protein [Vibrio sinaloensis DSM 21326]|uniref:Coenzyme F390 synthetase-like protein n=1 Tax=Vibrio sinaloensis DSM 21326 TaxID=945550 RepID=E8MA11_PHOS4|nr:phenylacetate--CoA ligase family protein [Vibrio sinaloensis]EGA69204.1 Coenzyme F390 synthetase-like protein [Vibrio sinaloensis DSM 21326]